MLLEISGPRGVQLDVFRSLKRGPVEIFWELQGVLLEVSGVVLEVL